MNAARLTLQTLCKTYTTAAGSQQVLHDISTEFVQGTTYAITGASGCGKSTLLHVAAGLDKPTSGNVFYDKIDIYRLSERNKDRLLNQTFGFVFQFHYLIKELSVRENIALPGMILGTSSRQADLKRADELLSRVGLQHKAEMYPAQLSGGEQQRISVLRAVFNKPQFLFADEPTGNLDANNARHIVDLLMMCQREWSMGIIICSHDPAISMKMDHTMRLCDGDLEQIAPDE